MLRGCVGFTAGTACWYCRWYPYYSAPDSQEPFVEKFRCCRCCRLLSLFFAALAIPVNYNTTPGSQRPMHGKKQRSAASFRFLSIEVNTKELAS